MPLLFWLFISFYKQHAIPYLFFGVCCLAGFITTIKLRDKALTVGSVLSLFTLLFVTVAPFVSLKVYVFIFSYSGLYQMITFGLGQMLGYILVPQSKGIKFEDHSIQHTEHFYFHGIQKSCIEAEEAKLFFGTLCFFTAYLLNIRAKIKVLVDSNQKLRQ